MFWEHCRARWRASDIRSLLSFRVTWDSGRAGGAGNRGRCQSRWGGGYYETSVWQLGGGDARVYFVDVPPLFGRDGLYGDSRGEFPDNHIRFAVLSKAAIEIVRRIFPADIIHCHDWQASLVPAYLKDPRAVDPSLVNIRTLLTIHNLGYQGVFGKNVLEELGLPAAYDNPAAMEFWGNISFLKGGIVFADALNTVSRKYAEEIQTPEYGFGMDGLLRDRRNVLSGIVNGVDYARWDPENDTAIPAKYTAAQIAAGKASGKQTCKRELLREMGLPEAAMHRPLLGVVSRFAAQKGLELIGQAAEELFAGGCVSGRAGERRMAPRRDVSLDAVEIRRKSGGAVRL